MPSNPDCNVYNSINTASQWECLYWCVQLCVCVKSVILIKWCHCLYSAFDEMHQNLIILLSLAELLHTKGTTCIGFTFSIVIFVVFWALSDHTYHTYCDNVIKPIMKCILKMAFGRCFRRCFIVFVYSNVSFAIRII